MVLANTRNKNYYNQNPLLEKSFSIFMALYPLLCIYEGFASFTIGDLILISFFVITLFKQTNIKLDNRTITIAAFIIYAFVLLGINLVLSNISIEYGTTALLLRIFKFAFYMVCALLCGKNFINDTIFKKTLIICAVASCVFLFIQYILFYSTGRIILGQIPGLRLHLSEYSDQDYETIFEYNYRPSSFFLEPALFVHYVIVALVFVLFYKSETSNAHKIVLILLLTLGIVMSTSAQGILYLVIVFTVYMIRGIKNKANAIGFAILFICIALICYGSLDVLQNAVDRLINNENAAEARLGSYRYCFKLPTLKFFFGNGYGTTPHDEYMAGAAYVWYGCGIIGLLLVLCIFSSLRLKATNNISKLLCLLFFVMFFGTSLFYNYMVYWYFSLIMTNFHTITFRHKHSATLSQQHVSS